MVKIYQLEFSKWFQVALPVDAKFSKSKKMSLSQEKSAIKHPHVLGLGEVFLGLK